MTVHPFRLFFRDPDIPAAGAPPETAPIGDTPAPPDSTPETSSWAGELASLDAEPWYTVLPEDVRPALRTGYENKLKNYDKGWQEKTRKVTEERQTWEKERQKLNSELEDTRRQTDLYGTIMKGHEDPRVTEFEKEQAAWATERAKIAAERGEWTKERKAFEERLAEQIAAKELEYKPVVERLRTIEEREEATEEARIVAAYPDIIANDEARKLWIDLQLVSKVPEDRATLMVRAAFSLGEPAPAVRVPPTPPPPAVRAPAAPPKPAAEPVPDTVALASPGDAPRSHLRGNLESEDDRSALQRAAERTASRLGV